MIDKSILSAFMPKYLSPNASDKLFYDLAQFPNNIDKRLYHDDLLKEKTLFQGDGIDNLIFFSIPDDKKIVTKGIVISNTCDISDENNRLFQPYVCYAPIISFEKYGELVVKTNTYSSEQQYNNHMNDVRKQKISHMFFLPKGSCLKTDYVAFFDRVCSCPLKYLPPIGETSSRLFVLSDYGFYLFLFKLSIHFTRMQEKVSRSAF